MVLSGSQACVSKHAFWFVRGENRTGMSSECKVQEEGYGNIRVCHLACRCLESCGCSYLHYRIQFASRVTTALALCHFELMTSYPGFVDPELITYWHWLLLYAWNCWLRSWTKLLFCHEFNSIPDISKGSSIYIHISTAGQSRNAQKRRYISFGVYNDYATDYGHVPFGTSKSLTSILMFKLRLFIKENCAMNMQATERSSLCSAIAWALNGCSIVCSD